MTINVMVYTFDPENNETDQKEMVFASRGEAFTWLDNQETLPGIRGTQYITGNRTLEFHIFQHQKVWVGAVTGGRREITDPPAIYVSDTEIGLHDLIRLQNDIPEDYGTSAFFEDQGEYLHVDSYYVE